VSQEGVFLSDYEHILWVDGLSSGACRWCKARGVRMSASSVVREVRADAPDDFGLIAAAACFGCCVQLHDLGVDIRFPRRELFDDVKQ
jgi:hypothetical protein